ncbi:MAG: IS630 family transposase [Acidobacteria bacterium]|nr:IS630 family transposase [Acidobacteriota bacterium]
MKKYIIELSAEERHELQRLLRSGKTMARKATRARILLKADDGLSDEQIAEEVSTSVPTIERVRKRFVEESLKCLHEHSRPGQKLKLDPKAEAHLIAVACSKAPTGRRRWTLRLLADKAVELGLSASLSHEAVRQLSKKNKLKPWQKKQWCIPEVSSEFVARMEDVLDLYHEPYDPKRPKVCFDEKSKQLIAETRSPIRAAPGRVERYDFEYKRQGTANLFLFCEPQACWRHIEVTDRRTMVDCAQQLKWLVDERYPEADVIRLVGDQLNTHRIASLYEAFAPEEARRIARKLEFHHTPKHGSWLNLAEIELSVLEEQCLDRRIPDIETLKRETNAYEKQRNADKATIDWRFTAADARKKLQRLYPSIST